MTRLNADEKQEKKQTLPTSAYFCREFLGGLQKDKCVASNIRYISVWSFKQWNDIRACGNNEMMTNMTISYPRPLGLLMDKLLEYEKWIQRENSLKKQNKTTITKCELMKLVDTKRRHRVCVCICVQVSLLCVSPGRKEVMVLQRLLLPGVIWTWGGERSRVTWSLKIPQSPKDGCQGNREEDGYWTSHHFYCQLPYTRNLAVVQGSGAASQ